MELNLHLFTLFFSFIVTIFLFFLKKHKTRTNPKIPFPPGSLGWPILGETRTFFSMAKKGLQHRFIADRATKHSSPHVFKTSLVGETMAVMCTPEANKFLFTNENKLVRSWWPATFEKIFSPSDGHTSFYDSNKQLRQLVVPMFLKPQSLRTYAPTLDSMTKNHLNRFWAGEPVVPVQDLVRSHTFGLVCRLLLSVDDGFLVKTLERHVKEIGIGMISLPVDLPGTRYRRALRASKAFRKEIVELVRARKTIMHDSREQDLLSYLVKQVDEKGETLSELDISDKVLAVIVGAHETTTTAIVSVVNYLADLPHVYDQVRTEHMEIANSKGKEELLNWEDTQKMTYSWNVAREALRLVPPVYGTFREVVVDFDFQGFFIPKGWKLHWNAYATHRNPKYFHDPENFDPSRFEGNGPIPYSFVPFGGGVRMCPGYEFARLKILIFMHNLVTNYKFEKVFPDEKIVCDPNPAPTRGLPIRLFPY